MLLLRPTDSDMLEAKRRSSAMGVLPSSRSKGQGNIIGLLAEAMVLQYCGGILIDDYGADILIDGLRIDVKTKSCSTPPKAHYLCSVMQYQLHHECDGYIFARANLTTKEVWLLGFITKDRFLAESIPFTKGDLDGDFAVKEDCRSIAIFDLDEIPTKS